MLVSWDDDIPNIWKNIKMFQTTNQSILDLFLAPGRAQYIGINLSSGAHGGHLDYPPMS